jgi:hypothetical protein
MSIQVSSLLTKAMLVSLHISQWNINRKDKQATAELKVAFDSEDGWARGNKSIADKQDLAKVTTLINKARDFHKTNTLPWNDFDSQRILPTRNYQFYVAEMRKFADEIESEVRALDIDSIKQNAKVALKAHLPNSLYNEMDYPADNYALRDKFKLDFNVVPIPAANDFRITQISQEDIDKMKAQVEAQLVESQKGIMRELFGRLHEVVESANVAFKNPEAGFNQSKIDNIGKVIEVLRRLNVDDDPKLERLCKIAEERVCTLDAKDLKKDINERKQAAATTSKLLDMMSEYN